MKRALVTGATGCVGRNIVDELLKENWEVIVAHRKTSDISRLKGLKVAFCEIDFYSLESVRKSIPESLDAIFHAAGNTSHWSKEIQEQWKDNVLVTRNLVQAALEKQVKRFIFTSTGATQNYRTLDKRFAENIYPPYVRSKRLAELEVFDGIEKGLDAVILQPIIVIGAFDYNSYAQIFKGVAKTKFPLALPGRLAFCHARDVAKAHLQAFEKGHCAEHYVLGGTYTTWKEVFEKIARIQGNSRKVRVVPQWLLWAVSQVLRPISYLTGKKPSLTPELVSLLRDSPDVTYYEKRKAQLDLGYVSGSLDSMIQDCYSWLKLEGRLK